MISAETAPLLTLAGVSRSYGPLQALKEIDLAVASGQCIALLGVNGSGKSTLLRIAAGRDTPTSGQVRYDGQVLREDALAARTEIAVVGDASSAYPDLTVREHLLIVAIAHGGGASSPGLVDAALAECRLAEHAAALPGWLSTGQRQALQLAAVLVRPRRLLILDEPEQRLDPAARRRRAAGQGEGSGGRAAARDSPRRAGRGRRRRGDRAPGRSCGRAGNARPGPGRPAMTR